MRKILLAIALLVAATSTQAQETPKWGTPITTQPDGQFFDWQTGEGTSANVDWLITVEKDDCFRCRYVLADDAIYLRDPFIKATTDTWLKLDKLTDSTYVAHLPQAIMLFEEDGKTYSFSARRFIFKNTNPAKYTDERAAMYAQFYMPDSLPDGTVRTDIYFKYKDQVLTQEDSCWLALVNDSTDEFSGYGTKELVVRPMNDKPNIPTEADTANVDPSWVLHYAVNDSVFNNIFVKVAVAGNNFYLVNPAQTDTTEWIKGTINGDTLTIDNNQYLEFNTKSQHYVYALALNYIDKDTVDYYGDPYTERIYDFTRPNIKFSVGDNGESFTAGKGTALAINASKRRIYQYGLYPDPQIFKFHEVEATPAAPIWKRADAYNEDYGYGMVVFQQPETDKDNKFINFNKLYFRLYVDDETKPFIFEPDEYSGITESSNMLPVRLENDNYFTIGDQHYLHYFFEGWNRLGLQAVYLGGGVERSSDIVWYNDPTAIKSVEESSRTSESYYDLTGRKVSPSYKGMVIKMTTTANGPKKIQKIINQ